MILNNGFIAFHIITCLISIFQSFKSLNFIIFVFQSGTTKVVQHLSENLNENFGAKIWFLMPCHSTPFHSHFHLTNADLRFLECPPKLSENSELDEDEKFYQNPLEFLEQNFEHFSPTHIVTFDSMSEILKDFLAAKHFEKCHRFFHSHFPEGRVGSWVDVHCRGKK